MVHGVLEELDWDEPFNLVEMHQALEQQKDIHDPDRILTSKDMDLGFQLLTEFVDRHEDESFNVLATEMPFAIVIGTAFISGFIDRVDDEGDRIKVVDYKTGRKEVTYKDIDKDLQLSIYALAMSKKFNKPIYAEMYYLRTARQKGHLFTQEELDAVELRLIDLVNGMINDLNYVCTTNVKICSFCDARKTGDCSVGVSRLGRG